MAGKPHRVVVIGGGFAGLYTVKGLAKAKDEVAITLIDRRNFHLFQPLLYQVATGGLSPGDIAAPLRAVFSRQVNTRVILGEVIDFDVANQKVIMSDGECEYDTLVVAAGAVSTYFGHDEWQELAPSLKSVEEATEMRHRLLFAFEEAEKIDDPAERKAWLTFVIVGAGATGVELAGTFCEIANDTLKHDFRRFQPKDARIFLVDSNDRVLKSYPPDLSQKAEQQLVELGARFLPSRKMTHIDENGVTLQGPNGEERIDAKTVIWAAGVAASPLAKKLAVKTGAETSRAGNIRVEPDCTIKGHPEIFVIGDAAWHDDKKGNPLPGVAPNAIQQGQYTAKAILKQLRGEPLSPFEYWDKGSMATIGRNRAVADLHWTKFSGFPAWLAWFFVHLFYLVGFDNRVVVVFLWALQYFTFNRGARLITGAGKMLIDKSVRQPDAAVKA